MCGRFSLGATTTDEEITRAVQGVFKRDNLSGFAYAGARNGVGPNFRSHAALLTDVRQVGGEAVADVDHGNCHSFLPQEAAKFDSRLRIEVFGKILWPQFLFLAGEE